VKRRNNLIAYHTVRSIKDAKSEGMKFVEWAETPVGGISLALIPDRKLLYAMFRSVRKWNESRA
jgi:hypothetical protein